MNDSQLRIVGPWTRHERFGRGQPHLCTLSRQRLHGIAVWHPRRRNAGSRGTLVLRDGSVR